MHFRKQSDFLVCGNADHHRHSEVYSKFCRVFYNFLYLLLCFGRHVVLGNELQHLVFQSAFLEVALLGHLLYVQAHQCDGVVREHV